MTPERYILQDSIFPLNIRKIHCATKQIVLQIHIIQMKKHKDFLSYVVSA